MWDNLSDEQEYPNGITAIAAAVCKNVPQQVPTLVEELEPILKQVRSAHAIDTVAEPLAVVLRPLVLYPCRCTIHSVPWRRPCLPSLSTRVAREASNWSTA